MYSIKRGRFRDVSVAEQRSIVGYVTERQGGNSRKEQDLYIQDLNDYLIMDSIV